MFSPQEKRYLDIIDFLCQYHQISRESLLDISKDNKYLLFLLLKKNRCTDKEILSKILNLRTKSTISAGFRKAEERFFVNRDFRELYFRIEEELKKTI